MIEEQAMTSEKRAEILKGVGQTAAQKSLSDAMALPTRVQQENQIEVIMWASKSALAHVVYNREVHENIDPKVTADWIATQILELHNEIKAGGEVSLKKFGE